MSHHSTLTQQPIVANIADFDKLSGTRGERLLFNNRFLIVLACLFVTLFLGWKMTTLQLNASFEKMIPTSHPYIVNYLKNKADLVGLGNTVRISVESTNGDIFNAEYLETLRKLNDEVFLLPGVERPYMKSLWTPATRWMGVTEEGMDGGPVIPDDYNASEQSIKQVRQNVERSGEIGTLVAANFKSSIVAVPLMEKNESTGKRLDYGTLSAQLEQIRAKYQTDSIRIHITGFAKIVGDLIQGLRQVMMFFAVAIGIAACILYFHTRCVRSTLLVVSCSLVAVTWLLGILPTIGYELDPYSILVPFLVFAIGMSHGAQKMNGIMQDIGRGTHKLVAARYTFRRLFVAGLTALLADAVGFGVLMVIDIKVIQELAITASIGVMILIFTNLILLPILLSYTGVSVKAAKRAIQSEQSAQGKRKHLIWAFLDLFTQRRWAAVAIGVALVMGISGYWVSRGLKIGDLDPGAPELRADSRYNRDNAFMAANYGASSDVFVVMVKTPPMLCNQYNTLSQVDALEWRLRQLPAVVTTNSLADLSKNWSMGQYEGNPKWYVLPRMQGLLGATVARAPRELFNQKCDLLTVYVFLKDHKADTLESVVNVAEKFAQDNNTKDVQYLLAAGNAGIEAATNVVVKRANVEMLVLVYLAVMVLSFITFRSWRAIVCAVLPLMLTSILCEALMVGLGIGVKVATLPVIALGVGIGIDYALYILSVTLTRYREGANLSEAYYSALTFTGRVIILTGITLGLGVVTWVFSPIKFQADMGSLLAFMFVWNMIGALILVPSLACFLLKRSPAEDAAKTAGSKQVHALDAGRAKLKAG